MINNNDSKICEPIIYLIGSNHELWQDNLYRKLLEKNIDLDIRAPLRERQVNIGTELLNINKPYRDNTHTIIYYLKNALEDGIIVLNLKEHINSEYINNYLYLLNMLKKINNVKSSTCFIYGEERELLDKVNNVFDEIIMENDFDVLCSNIIDVYLQKKEICNKNNIYQKE